MEFRDKTEQFGVFAIGLFDGKLTLGDLFPPCHRRRNVDSNVFIELSTVGIDTNTVVINYRREEGGTTWVNPGDFLRTIFGLLGRFLVTPLGLLWNHFVGAW